ncbi:plasmalemma vesicle-associated protein isoform X2 [Varanus komodoensis]|uniref:plasmalemma vesicle-associated protein isoform X2 n=1 Tax=Varanus komodoensis TaxID=61221 RepID=UPI001CF7B23E|nr:plasmalemma vesicle-associated protein isoform X2 [Varanus komodoensis]
MEKNPYSMAKLSLDTKSGTGPKRDCCFYAKYFFLFLSLIQFLIILGLVLFMVYGKPEEVTKKRLEGLSDQVEQCRKKSADLGTEIAALKRQLNSSRAESAKTHLEATRINNTLKACTFEKAKMADQQKNQGYTQKMLQECIFNFQILNMTCPVQLSSLQDQLKMESHILQESKETHTRQAQALQERLQMAEKERQDCQVEKMHLQKQGDTYRLLESRVLDAMSPVREALRGAVDRTFLSPPHSCYDFSTIHQACLTLGPSLQSQVEGLARQVDQKVAEVAQRTADLERDKASCGHGLQELQRQISAEQERCKRDKQLLQEAQDGETKKMYGERQKLVGEKEMLKMQLEQSKEACLRTRINTSPPIHTGLRIPGASAGLNPFALNLPLNTGGAANPIGPVAAPNTYSNPLGRPQGLPGPHTLSPAERMRIQELLKENAKKQNQTMAVKPEARPR